MLLDLHARQDKKVKFVLLIIVGGGFGYALGITLYNGLVTGNAEAHGHVGLVGIVVHGRHALHQLDDAVHGLGGNHSAGVGGGHCKRGAFLLGQLAKQMDTVSDCHILQPCPAVHGGIRGVLIGSSPGSAAGLLFLPLDLGNCAGAHLTAQLRRLSGVGFDLGLFLIQFANLSQQSLGLGLIIVGSSHHIPDFRQTVQNLINSFHKFTSNKSFSVLVWLRLCSAFRRSSVSSAINPSQKLRADISVASLAGSDTAETS